MSIWAQVQANVFLHMGPLTNGGAPGPISLSPVNPMFHQVSVVRSHANSWVTGGPWLELRGGDPSLSLV